MNTLGLCGIGYGGAQWRDGQDRPFVRIHAYQAGTDVPAMLFRDGSGLNPHANPLQLEDGRVPGGGVWIEHGAPLKFVFEDADGQRAFTLERVNTIDVDRLAAGGAA